MNLSYSAKSTGKQFSADKRNRYLHSLLVVDASAAMHMIYNTLVSWVHRTYKDRGEHQAAYDKFINHAHEVISSQPLYYSRDKIQALNYGELKAVEEIAAELRSLLDGLPSENAIEFLGELTGAWCLYCPKEKVKQFYQDENISNVELANILFSWPLRPFDFFW